MKKISIKLWLEKVRLGALRFPFTLIFLIGTSVLLFLQINQPGVKIPTHTWAFFSLGVVLSIAVTLFSENFKNFFIRIGLNLLAAGLLMTYCFTLPQVYQAAHIYQVIALGVVFTLSALFAPFFHKKSDIPFWEFNKTSILQLIISVVFAQIIMMGLSLAVLSLKELFRIDIHPEVYQNLAVVCYALFAPIYFLAHIPDEIDKFDQTYSFPKFLKILGLYIVLPILTLYSVILYVYLIQIIVKWQLPNGWVSWLVSILGVGGFLCMHMLFPLRMEKENRIANFVSRYFPVVLLPLLVLMSVGIFRRFSDYGITINRLYVLILNVWLYGISIYLFISQSKHLKWIAISFAAVTFISSVGSWSVYSITKRTMIKEIGQLLDHSKLLKNGKAIDNSDFATKLDSATTVKLTGKIEYTFSTYGAVVLQPYFSDSITGVTSNDLIKRLGLDNEFSTNPTLYFSAALADNPPVNVQNFRYFIRINSANEKEDIKAGNSFRVKYRNNTFIISKGIGDVQLASIPMKTILAKVIRLNKRKQNYSTEELSVKGNGYLLIINNINLFKQQKSDSITISSINASLFLK